jgi:CheY-like chemotaxis protein
VLEQLASTDLTAQIPVVILSGDSGQSTVQQLLAWFLAKPFTVPEFIATLDRFLVRPAG